MGFLKDLGKLTGSIAGIAIGAPICLVGSVVKSDLIQQIGQDACNVTTHTGELLGTVAEGTTETVYGALTSNKSMQKNGTDKIIKSGSSYAKGVITGVANMAIKGGQTIEAIANGDTEKAIKTGKEIVKTVAVGALSIGVLDAIDGLDFDDFDFDNDDFDDLDERTVENPNTHYVTPHERVLPSGRTIWVDGDGDTSVDLGRGWYQTNPNYKA